MNGKSLVVLLGLVFCLWAFLLESTPISAKEWTIEQKAVADSFQKLVEAAVKGDIGKLKSFWHPKISWWYFKEEHPVGIEVYLKGLEEIYKSKVKWISCESEPLEIHVVGNVAILYATYKNILKDPEGKETVMSGPWTSVLIKQENKWLFLSNSWTSE